MGSCFSSANKVCGSSSSNAAAANNNNAKHQKRKEPEVHDKQREEEDEQQKARQKDKGQQRRPVTSCGKKTDFGYARDFESRYAIGKLLGHGQFGYTFVATDKKNGDRVAVKRIERNKVKSFLFC